MNYVAIDLGAESGRVILGTVSNGRIAMEEIHRFPNGAEERNGSLLWKFDRLTNGILEGLKQVAARGLPIASVSADSWGVDYVLNGDTQEVYFYRDARGQRGSQKILAALPWEKIFAETGIQYMPINTLFQLAAESRPFANEGSLLGVADHFNQFLGGAAVVEESMASTFQIYNPKQRAWSEPLRQLLTIPEKQLSPVVPSGTITGQFDPRHFNSPAFQNTKIIATCSHDTGAAVAAVPADAKTKLAYLSSGTWSLMGVELPPLPQQSAIPNPQSAFQNQSAIRNPQSAILPSLSPIITDLSRELNFTNEIGYGSTIRLLKNISGLWLLQECRRAWGQYDYTKLTQLASESEPFRSLINPADPRFLAPASMPQEIAAACEATGQPVPETPGQFTRCIFESLALLYRKTLLQLEQLTQIKLEVLHIVGGGSKNALLNQFTANACQIPVLAGPVEATALGNIIIQAITMGEIPDLPAARKMIRENFELTRFNPSETNDWPEAFARFEKLG
jgi:rhamnulokinase